MTPDKRDRARARAKQRAPARRAPTAPSSDDVHDIVYFQRHPNDHRNTSVPGREQLNSWPAGVRAKARAVLAAVAAAPPKRYSGGGYWEAMHGAMSGWHEIRVDGPGRTHYRLFCLLDYEAKGKHKPLLVVIDGRVKAFQTTLADVEYAKVGALGAEYRARNPRSLYGDTAT